MSEETCPHCGSKLPIVRDAYCTFCRESLDEPPEVPRTPEEQEAFQAKVEQDAKAGICALGSLFDFWLIPKLVIWDFLRRRKQQSHGTGFSKSRLKTKENTNEPNP